MERFHFQAKIRIFLGVGILVFGLAVSAVVFAQPRLIDDEGIVSEPTEEQITSAGIVFPVAELGNCGNKDECRGFCNEPGNMPACIRFAKSHGLMNDEEAARAEKFAETVRTRSGPGGCTTPEGCRAYCGDVSRLDECLAFAESHGVKDRHIEEAKKIRAHLKIGGTLPGGCTSKESCEQYCGNFEHAEECLAFAERAELDVSEFHEGPPPRKILELLRSGETPGGCKSKNECESYCREDGHFEECIAFAEKAGFIKPDEAERARKTGGRGPGGCNSEASCRAYCDDSLHQEECFSFAKDHGILREEDLMRAKEGFVRLRQGLENAPPEVAECLKSKLGPNIIADIQSGSLTPGPQIGERVRECFGKFGERPNPDEVFRHAPPEVISCAKNKLGERFEKIRSGELEFTPELGDVFRVCFQSLELERGSFGRPDGSAREVPGEGGGSRVHQFGTFLNSAPPSVKECVRAKVGGAIETIGERGGPPASEIERVVRGCFQGFEPEPFPAGRRPQIAPVPLPPGDRRDFPFDELPARSIAPPDSGAAGVRELLNNVPPEVLRCLEGTLGGDALLKLREGGVPGSDFRVRVEECYRNVQGSTAPSLEPKSIIPAPSPAQGPVTVPYEQYLGPAYPTTDTPICADFESCKRVCTDTANEHYNSSQCASVRSQIEQQTGTQPSSRAPLLLRILGTLIGPFVNLGAK